MSVWQNAHLVTLNGIQHAIRGCSELRRVSFSHLLRFRLCR